MRPALAYLITRKARARELLAAKIEAGGPSHVNVANSVRAGFSNLWIAAALEAIEDALGQRPEDMAG